MDVTIDAASVDVGFEALDKHLMSPDFLDVAKYPTATFKGKSMTFNGDVPVSVQGDFTLHGVTRPLTLTINKFKCVQDKMLKREVCGADASAEFKRTDYGITFGGNAFAPEVRLQKDKPRRARIVTAPPLTSASPRLKYPQIAYSRYGSWNSRGMSRR